MAEIILSAFLSVLFEKLGSAALEKHARVNSQIKKWQRSLLQIRDVLTDASQKEITGQSVKCYNMRKVIFESLTSENKNFSDLNLLQVAIRNQLRDKQFLIVLDDVWSEGYEDWETLCLLYDDAVSLFAQHALGVNNFDLHLTLKEHGEAIIRKWDGLPLALMVLRRLLNTKMDEEEYWEELLNSEVWMLQDGGSILPALRLSYNDLTAHLKQLFAYCSLFPKDYVFEKNDLILLWMAEGFLHLSTSSTSTQEHVGHAYFEALLSRSFFQIVPNEDSLFVMHDLMNELATSVAEDFFLRLDDGMDRDIKKHVLDKYRHMSFVRERYETHKKFEAFKRTKSLRTFLATSAGVLPESIGSLRHLRYLNLSRTLITWLKENVCNLYNLQTLILFGCQSLTKLPNSFIKLKNLRRFDIRKTPLLKMPLVISELKSLQTLSKIIIRGENGFEINGLKDLRNLCGKISILGLEKVQSSSHAREANFLQKRLTELEVRWNDVFDISRKEMLDKEVLNELKPLYENLKMLKFVSYGGMELPNWVGDPLFLRLKHVQISGCKNCKSLPPFGQLPSLKELYIGGMDGLKVSLSFPSLEILCFKNMLGREVWSSDFGDVFPCLQKLVIRKCPNLAEVSLGALPSRRDLTLDGCGDVVLRTLIQVASSVSKVCISCISGLTDEVWEGVIKYLGAVKELGLWDCNEVRYLWKSETNASKVLLTIRKLLVHSCDNLVRLGHKEDDLGDNHESNLLTSLRTLSVLSCKSMERGWHKLSSLSIINCNQLLEKEFVGVNINTRSGISLLEDVDIRCWPHLKTIIGFNYFIHLTRMTIEDCGSLKSGVIVEDATVEAIRIRAKWENDDYICRGHILNGMSDSLFDVYTNVELAKELWDSLESKYMAEDSSSKKFLVSNFNNYKMVDSRPVMEQYNVLLRILGQYTQHGLKMDESIFVSSIIDKFASSLKGILNILEHGKENLSWFNIGIILAIEDH
ncbi:putative disease resistance RPP13-like protein 1 [Tanacetum coccineum]